MERVGFMVHVFVIWIGGMDLVRSIFYYICTAGIHTSPSIASRSSTDCLVSHLFPFFPSLIVMPTSRQPAASIFYFCTLPKHHQNHNPLALKLVHNFCFMLRHFLSSCINQTFFEDRSSYRVMREIPSTYCSCSDDDSDQESNAQTDNSASPLLLSLLIQPIVPRTLNLSRCSTPTLHTRLSTLLIRHLRHLNRNTESLPKHRISNQPTCRRQFCWLCKWNCAYWACVNFLFERRGTHDVRFAGSFVASHFVYGISSFVAVFCLGELGSRGDVLALCRTCASISSLLIPPHSSTRMYAPFSNPNSN